jgi:hypothetical protein
MFVFGSVTPETVTRAEFVASKSCEKIGVVGTSFCSTVTWDFFEIARQ